jgi:hypothetical protein
VSQQDGGFGRRGPQSLRDVPTSVSSGSRSSQIGAVALAVALAFAVGGGGVYYMKQAGKSLGANFVERATPGNPANAIEQVGGGDALLQKIHRTCTSQLPNIDLTPEQRRVVDGNTSLNGGELQVAQAAAYVACLTTEQPQRFCQQPHRQHLMEAVRQYMKLAAQVHEEWQLQMSGPAGTSIAPPPSFGQLAAIGMPSARLDPKVQEGLVALDTNGYIPAGDFVRFMGLSLPGAMPRALGGTPRGMPQPFGGNPPGTQSRKSACS